jgi:phosphoribosylglycinamide formyltransferase 2
LAAKELGLKTANYRYATTAEEAWALKPLECHACKPLMCSSGKDNPPSNFGWYRKSLQYAVDGSRGDVVEIVEAFVKFNSRLLY